MHKDDQMTPLERMAAFSQGKEIDRIPAMPFLSTVGPRIAGISLRELRASGKNEAEVQIAAYERLGADVLTVDYGLHGVGTALGSRTNNPEFGVPAIIDFVLKDLKDINTLDPSLAELPKDIELRNHCEAVEILLDKLGHECGVDVTISGPFTAASSIYPTAEVLRATKKDSENLHRLLSFCTDILKNICKEFNKYGVSFTLCDPTASGTVLKASQYKEFVFPYTKELVSYIHGLGGEVAYHICGDSTKIMEDMVDTGVDLLSLDNIVDMECAKNKVGDRICIVGNVDPVDVIMLGDATGIDQAVKECFRKSYDSPKGFIIATGCDIPYDTPLENVDMFMQCARKYGKWPLDGSRY